MTHLLRPEGHTGDELRLTRRMLGGLFFSGYATAALAQSAQPVTTSAEGLVIDEVSYLAPDGFDLPAYVARPAGDGPHPCVVVVSEIFGVHDYIKDVCRRLARSGYVAIAPAFFVRVEDPAPLSDMARIRQIVNAAGHEQVMGDVSATLEWLSGQLYADAERLGITGFCWGGAVTWMACARFAAFDAGVAWYGRLVPPEQSTGETRPWPVDVAADLKAPVLGLYAENDAGIPLSSVEQMREALIASGQGDSRIDVYPGTQHGFHADYRASYDEAAAREGWAALLAHFSAHL